MGATRAAFSVMKARDMKIWKSDTNTVIKAMYLSSYQPYSVEVLSWLLIRGMTKNIMGEKRTLKRPQEKGRFIG